MSSVFSSIPTISYEGPQSDNPLSFKHYDPTARVGAKSMQEHLRFAMAYWHTLCGQASDPFGAGTLKRSWFDGGAPMIKAEKRMDAAFEFMTKMKIPFYCFHDRDMAPEGTTLSESHKNLDVMSRRAKEMQRETGVRLLWGTANLFSHPRYMNGAATNPDPHVVACAAAQVKKMLEVTHELGGENFVFWGGREGYDTLLNTHLKRELDHFAAFLHMAWDYARDIGFKGQLLIEPKPKEPTAHQYDVDAATVLGFLKTYDLIDKFKLNIEANHANLAGHSFHHEVALASAYGVLGSIDANRGDPLLGWDTDQFPNDVLELTKVMMVVLEQGGLAPGGLNFDAKVRRASVTERDLFIAHIGAMDTFALALKKAWAIRENGYFTHALRERYQGFESGIGQKIERRETTLRELEAYALERGEPALQSGRQEELENRMNQFLWS